jgi:hypothetical protein
MCVQRAQIQHACNVLMLLKASLSCSSARSRVMIGSVATAIGVAAAAAAAGTTELEPVCQQ